MTIYEDIFGFEDNLGKILFYINTKIIKDKEIDIQVSIKNEDTVHLKEIFPEDFYKNEWMDVEFVGILQILVIFNPVDCDIYMARIKQEIKGEFPDWIKECFLNADELIGNIIHIDILAVLHKEIVMRVFEKPKVKDDELNLSCSNIEENRKNNLQSMKNFNKFIKNIIKKIVIVLKDDVEG